MAKKASKNRMRKRSNNRKAIKAFMKNIDKIEGIFDNISIGESVKVTNRVRLIHPITAELVRKSKSDEIFEFLGMYDHPISKFKQWPKFRELETDQEITIHPNALINNMEVVGER